MTCKPIAFDEKVEICDEPLKKFCNKTVKVEEVCVSQYLQLRAVYILVFTTKSCFYLSIYD